MRIRSSGKVKKWQWQTNRDDGGTLACPQPEVVEAVAEGQGSYAFAFSPDGEILAVVGSRDNRVSLWKLPERQRVAQLKPLILKSRSSDYVRSLAFRPMGKSWLFFRARRCVAIVASSREAIDLATEA